MPSPHSLTLPKRPYKGLSLFLIPVRGSSDPVTTARRFRMPIDLLWRYASKHLAAENAGTLPGCQRCQRAPFLSSPNYRCRVLLVDVEVFLEDEEIIKYT